jgi:hypothetical protein
MLSICHPELARLAGEERDLFFHLIKAGEIPCFRATGDGTQSAYFFLP